MEWRAMKMAPRDGTQILVARWNDCMWEYFVVWWTGREDYPWEGDRNSYTEDRLDLWCNISGPVIPE